MNGATLREDADWNKELYGHPIKNREMAFLNFIYLSPLIAAPLSLISVIFAPKWLTLILIALWALLPPLVFWIDYLDRRTERKNRNGQK